MTRRRLSREFKLEAVQLATERGVGVAQAARDLDLHQTVRGRRATSARSSMSKVLCELKLPSTKPAAAQRASDTLDDWSLWGWVASVPEWSA